MAATGEDVPVTEPEVAADAAAAADDGAAAGDATDAAPAVPKRVGRPNRDNFDKKIGGFRARRSEIAAEQKALQQKRSAGQSQRTALNSKINEARARIGEIRAERNVVNRELQALYDAKNAIKAAQAKRREERTKARSSAKPASLRSVNENIRDLETRQQTETLSLAEEKTVIKELAELYQLRKTLTANESKTAALVPAGTGAGEKDQWAALSAEIAVKRPQRDAIDERVQAQVKILEALKKERDELFAGQNTRERSQALSEEYKDLQRQENEFRAEWDQHWKDFKAWSSYKKAQDDIKYAAIRAEKQAKYEAEKKRMEEEEAKRHPWEAEMGLCDALVAQLKELAPELVAAAEESKGDAGAGSAGNGVDNSGLKVMSKEVEDPWGGLGGGKKKKKGKKRGKKGGKKAALRFDLYSHECFQRVGVTVPRTKEEIVATIDTLNAKKAEFDVKPRPAKKGKNAKAAAAAAAGEGAGNGEAAVPATAEGEASA